ncbi:MAG: CDP-alcohol phosphatidyltransferase family protein [Paludisphaera borealis]|uniref:CDP-alcohol phosphatidyltransferase family protein n=1 Tax=Paludisphaera borealis TaxID=1387353 RepID=UPI00284DED26|nr:CDP-alcohol phosphatidyltransferase family protein [Paludisphaera borealis]MDR3620882.1 CDP-alcohol phosphatidyltransferase family protein [Paludisphaera borealis]
MSADRPSLAQLRAVVQKGRHREIGNWLARRVARPSAVYGTWLAVRLGITANQATLASLAASLGGAVAIGSGDRVAFVAGVGLCHLAFWLDHVDGQIARWRGTASLDGVYCDYLMHHVANLALGFALGFGLAERTGGLFWAPVGFAIAAGWAVLSLHNDCRYKAFFQRLKSSPENYRVDGGAGGRPAPPPAWPRRGRAAITYPLYKACEPHVVLLGLTGLAALALADPRAWEACWKACSLPMAVIAPLLGAARVARSVSRRSTEAEFRAWFRPIGEFVAGAGDGNVVSRHRPLDMAGDDVVSPTAEDRSNEAA